MTDPQQHAEEIAEQIIKVVREKGHLPEHDLKSYITAVVLTLVEDLEDYKRYLKMSHATNKRRGKVIADLKELLRQAEAVSNDAKACRTFAAGLPAGRAFNEFGGNIVGRLYTLREELDDGQRRINEIRDDAERRMRLHAETIVGLKAELRTAEERANPDMTNAQYHAQVDKLWAAITPTETLYDSVFDAVVAEIQDLKAERQRLEAELREAE